MPYADGINRIIVLAEETTYGTQASGPGQIIRRSNFSMDDQRPEVPSSLILPDAQAVDAHIGVPSLAGSISGEAAPGTHKMIYESTCRGTWTTGVSVTGKTDTVVVTNATQITITSASSNFLTTGFKIGHIARVSGATTTGAPINGLNLLVTGVTATVLTCAPNAAVVAWASGQTVAITVTGKTLIMPLQASQVHRSHSMEDWSADIARSRLGLGIKFASIGLNVQPNGFVNFQASFTGKNLVRSGTRVYGSPTAESTSDGIRPVNGTVLYDRAGSAGLIIAYITGFNLQISQALQPVPTIGAVDGPVNISGGMLGVRGSVTMMTTADDFDDDFFQQNDVEMTLLIPNSGALGADFMSIHMSRLRLSAAQRNDSDRAIMRSYNFAAYRKSTAGAGSAWANTSIILQDSLA